jgi:hypothetical protein
MAASTELMVEAGAPEDLRPEVDWDGLELNLAKTLHETLEHLQPSETPDWALLSERERDFFRICIKRILVTRDQIIKNFLKESPHDNSVHGGAQNRE